MQAFVITGEGYMLSTESSADAEVKPSLLGSLTSDSFVSASGNTPSTGILSTLYMAFNEVNTAFVMATISVIPNELS